MVRLSLLYLMAHIVVGKVTEVIQPVILHLLGQFHHLVRFDVRTPLRKRTDDTLHLPMTFAVLFTLNTQRSWNDDKLNMRRITLLTAILIHRLVSKREVDFLLS